MSIDTTGQTPLPGQPFAPVSQNHQPTISKKQPSQSSNKKKLIIHSTLVNNENELAINTPRTPLKNRLKSISDDASLKSEQLKRMASLFYSSRALKNLSGISPLTPLGIGNANDVYMKQILLSKKSEFFHDVFFKPGIEAAIRSKICYGLTQIFKNWQHVIAPAKECTATVISQEDYHVERTKVYNPHSKQYYLIKNEDIEDSKEINSLIKHHGIELEAVENHPGYYIITASENEDHVGEILMLYQEKLNNKLKSTEDNSGISYQTQANKILEINDDSEVTIDNVTYNVDLTDEGFVLENPNMSENALKKLSSNYYLLRDTENQNQILAPKSSCTPYTYIIGGTTKKNEEKSEINENEAEIDEDESKTEDDETKVIGREIIWISDEAIHTVNGKDYLKRNDQNYEIFNHQGKYSVIGQNIRGMAQLKVDNIFQKPAGADQPLNLLESSKERTEFYNRIDMPSFINAFIASILLRPQDGKVTNLGESNILFQALPNEKGAIDPEDPSCKLRPVHIDHDETMPKGNAFTQLKQFEGKSNVHCIRNGLMGFPQAHKTLSKDERALAEQNLDEIVAKKEEVQKFLTRFTGKNVQESFNQEHINAYTEVVNRIAQFRKENRNKEWMLSDLFFDVFPEYEEQWDELGSMNQERKAMYIGLESPQDVLKSKFL
jgi:hypothetical protein